MMARVLAPLAFVGLLLLAWQGYVVLSDVPSSTLPAPTDVASALRREKSVLLDAALVTAGEIAIGFTGAVLVGLLTGVAISRSRLALRASYPVLVASQMVPVPAIRLPPVRSPGVRTSLTARVNISPAEGPPTSPA